MTTAPSYTAPYTIVGLQTQQQALDQLAIVAVKQKPLVQQVLKEFGYAGDYLKSLGQAMFNPEFIAELAARLYSPYAQSFGGEDGWGEGMFIALGSLFQMGGSIASGVSGNKAAGQAAAAAKAQAQAQLNASYYNYQGILAGTKTKLQEFIANQNMVKMLMIGGGVLFVIVIIGLIAYKMLT